MRKFVHILASMFGVCFCLCAPIALWEGYRFLPRTSAPVPTLSYAEVTTIVLAALTIVLGFLALFVGGLAIWGYQSIKSEGIAAAEKSAEKATDTALKEAISKQFDEKAVNRMITAQLRKAIRREELSMSRRYSTAFPTDEGKEQVPSQTEHVGKEYPEDEGPHEG